MREAFQTVEEINEGSYLETVKPLVSREDGGVPARRAGRGYSPPGSARSDEGFQGERAHSLSVYGDWRGQTRAWHSSSNPSPLFGCIMVEARRFGCAPLIQIPPPPLAKWSLRGIEGVVLLSIFPDGLESMGCGYKHYLYHGKARHGMECWNITECNMRIMWATPK